MLKKQVAIILSSVLLTICCITPAVSYAQTDSDTARIEKNRASIEHLGINRNKKVELRLVDKTKVKGYITSLGSDSFTITDSRTSSGQTISYADISSAKKLGGGLSTKTILILAGVAVGVVVTWIIVKPAFCDGGADTRGIC